MLIYEALGQPTTINRDVKIKIVKATKQTFSCCQNFWRPWNTAEHQSISAPEVFRWTFKCTGLKMLNACLFCLATDNAYVYDCKSMSV